MALEPKHKHEMLAALDHIDGVLGDAMQQAHQHVAGVAAGMSGNVDPDPQADNKYEGQGNTGGHTGHPFGDSKDQRGSQNSHFGHHPEGEGVGPENPNFPRRGSLLGLLGSK